MSLEMVWFERRGGIRLGVVKKEGPKNLVLSEEDGTRRKIPRDRVLYTLRERLEDPRDLSRRARGEGAEAIDLELLWSSLEDDRSYQLGELAALYFGEVDDAKVAELVSGLTQEGSGRIETLFRLVRGAIRRVDAEARKLIEERRARQATEGALHARFKTWFEGWSRSDLGPPASAPTELTAELDLLFGLALDGSRGSSLARAKRLAAFLGMKPDADGALEGLIAAGALPKHVNELPRRKGIPTGFPAAARDAAAALLDLAARGEDLRALPTVAIDDADTHEVDDAISAWREDGVLYVGVHIARIGDRVPKGGPLDREALRRATSVYFPSSYLPMLPEDLAKSASLVEGVDRPALSLICKIGDDGLPGEGRFVASVVRIDRQATYADDSDPTVHAVLSDLGAVVRALRAERVEAGATLFSLPPLKVTVDEHGEPSARLLTTHTPANDVVSELMVLYNSRLAQRLAAAGLAALYRTQPQAVAPRKVDPDDPLCSLKIRRGLLPTKVAVKPAPHRPMGVSAYVQGTSPIRRLGDLIAQRQLLALLADQPAPYDASDLEKIRKTVSKLERRARMAEDDRRRYWICRWLEARTEPLTVCISRKAPRLMAYLGEIDREFACSAPHDLAVGTRAQATLGTCLPRQGEATLTIEPLQEQEQSSAPTAPIS